MAGVPLVKLEHLVNGSWLDVTSRLLWGSETGAPVELLRGIETDGGALIGTGAFTLDNSDGALTPRHPSSPHYPYLIRYRPVKLSVWISGAWQARHYGFLDSETLTFGNQPATDCRVTWLTIDHFGMAALKTLRSVAVEATAAQSTLLAYWPLTDAESVSAADQSTFGNPSLAVQQWGTGGEIGWSAGTILPTDNVGGLVFTPSSDNGIYLQSEGTIDLPASWSLLLWGYPAAKDGYLVQIGTDAYSLGVWYDTSTKKLSAIETKLDSNGDPIDYVLSTTTSTWAGGSETMTVTATTVKLGSSGTTGTRHGGGTMVGSYVSAGGAMAVESGRARMYSGELKHLAFYSGSVPGGTTDNFTPGPAVMFALESAVERVLGYGGVASTVANTSGTNQTVTLQKIEGLTALDVISNYARGSLARIYCAGDGTVQISAFDSIPTTVTVASGYIGLGIEWAADPAGDVTDAVMTWPDGSTYTATETASYRSGVSLPGVLSTVAGRGVADWVVAASDDTPGFPVAPFDLLSIPDADMPAIALLTPRSVVAIPGLPSQLPASTQQGVVSQLAETIGAEAWSLSVTIDTDTRDQTMLVGDATRGVVGSGYVVAPMGPTTGATGPWKAGEAITHTLLNSRAYQGGMTLAGVQAITPVASTPTSANVTFASAFPSAPKVVATPNTSVPGSEVVEVSVDNITTTGCRLWVYRTNTATTDINWVAVV